MSDNYSKSYKEVVEILKYLPQESVNKIPSSMLNMFKEKMDKDYFFVVDAEKKFEEQNLMEETKAIFANIFRDYWATTEQRESIISTENCDRQKIEEVKEKLRKYNSNEIFKNNIENNEKINQDGKVEDSNLPIKKMKEEKFYKKLITCIKRIFHLE